MTGGRPPAAPARRLFLACWPDPPTRTAMARAGRKPARGSGGRPVPPANLHVTLVFLGAVGEATLPSVMAVAAEAAGASRPFAVRFDRIAHWPRPQVLVAVPAVAPPAGAALADRLAAALADLGLAVERRPFRPHVTLARKVLRPPAGLTLRPVHWPVAELSLVESVTDQDGARYGVLGRWLLAAPGSRPEPPPAADSPAG